MIDSGAWMSHSFTPKHKKFFQTTQIHANEHASYSSPKDYIIT